MNLSRPCIKANLPEKMFYPLITAKRDAWLESDGCPVKELITYIVNRGMMRDAQIEAIKTYLFLKIEGKNQSLYKLFSSGIFNNVDLDSEPISHYLRSFLKQNPAACALYEYSIQKNDNGQLLSPKLTQYISTCYHEIDFERCLYDLFYGVDYADYIFSLPMGAGKTYLMAAFIYLDLYFASNEPDNPIFSHNFLVLIPSGLKSSILDSIRDIQEFDPSWVIPEPAATALKRMMKFEILDEAKSGQKSNIVRNPNAQKINAYQPFSSLMGLVAVVNAEKIILNRVEDANKNVSLFSKEELNKIFLANELRDLLAELPNLTLLVDEVHHAADSDIKLRKVINGWAAKGRVNCMLGFSGTPYLESADKIKIGDCFEVKSIELSNVVNHYPLIRAIGNFLKVPEVKYLSSSEHDEQALRRGIEDFLEKFGNLIYPNGTTAKQAIYCASIERLENEIYPLVTQILTEKGYNPSDTILKYHKGNKQFKADARGELEFKSLDLPLSKVKIVLLVQIGKEGWNCKSLTSVILPHQGACPKNMVLQTSCRCLRQVEKGTAESALIWLNSINAKVLNDQLQKQQNITLQEFGSVSLKEDIEIHRYSRMDKLEVPPIDFYQLKVEYTTEIEEDGMTVGERLQQCPLVEKEVIVAKTQDLEQNILDIESFVDKESECLTFNQWLLAIANEGFGHPLMQTLREHAPALRKIYQQIADEETRQLDDKYDHSAIRSNIRKCFSNRRQLKRSEDIVPESATLLHIDNLVTPIYVSSEALFAPTQEGVKKILHLDANPPASLEQIEALRKQCEALGIPMPQLPQNEYPYKDHTYHYLPYHFDSGFEKRFFLKSALPIITKHNLELYFNGDDLLTGFKIKCYQQQAGKWSYIGQYLPDFLLLSRREDGGIDRVCIIETKGEAYIEKFRSRRNFMESQFLKQNNEKFGYRRFHFLYIEDTMKPEAQQTLTINTINEFFNLQS